MQLNSAMSSIGKVLLFKGGDPISWLVKFQTRSIYSHAAILIPGTMQCIESYPGVGVRIRTITSADSIDFFDVKGMTEEQWKTAIDYAMKQIGKGYDWRGVFRFVSGVPAKENNKFFCSEFVFKVIEVSGIQMLNRISAADVSPGMIGISPYAIPASIVADFCIGKGST